MQEKWDKYFSGKVGAGECCLVLQEYSHLLPRQGCSLDLACGLGANALLLAEHGLESHGWDISSVALAKLHQSAVDRGLTVTTEQRNVEILAPAPNSFDVIVVSRFLYRPICASLVDALNPGGLLFYQTFNKHHSSAGGPRNPAYLLDTDELLSLFYSLTIIAHHEDGMPGNSQPGLGCQSYLLGQKPLF